MPSEQHAVTDRPHRAGSCSEVLLANMQEIYFVSADLSDMQQCFLDLGTIILPNF